MKACARFVTILHNLFQTILMLLRIGIILDVVVLDKDVVATHRRDGLLCSSQVLGEEW